MARERLKESNIRKIEPSDCGVQSGKESSQSLRR